MDTPLISVILPTYNGAFYLNDTIFSVLSQEYRDLELIIVDDASTDIRVAQIIQEFSKRDLRVRSYRNEANKERSWSKNFWVQKAIWDYIAFIDDDDIWNPAKLSRQIISLQKDNSLGIIGTYARFMDESGEILWETNHLKTNPKDIFENILFTNQFIHSSVLLKKWAFLLAWGFPIDMNLCEDYDLWLRILSSNSGANISESLVDYRVRSTSTTAHNIYRMKYHSILLTWKYRKLFPGFLKAMMMRVISFPFNTVFLMKIWRKLFMK